MLNLLKKGLGFRSVATVLLAVTLPVSGVFWYCRQGFQESSASAVIACLVILPILAAGIILAEIHRLFRPLTQLTRAVAAIARGGRPQALEVMSGQGEIDLLLNVFNDMLEQLDRTTVSRDYLDRLLGSMCDAFLLVDAEGLIQRVNPAACDLLSYPAEELIGLELSQTLAGDDVGFARGNRDPELLTGMQREAACLTKDGRTVPVLFSSAPRTDAQGNFLGLLCILRDMTEQKTTQEKMQNHQHFLESVLDSLTEEMLILKADDLTIIKANRAFQDAFRTSEEQVAGRVCHDIAHHRPQSCLGDKQACPSMQCLASGLPTTAEQEYQAPDGERRFMEVQVMPVYNSDGQPAYLIHIARDITRRKKAETEMHDFARQLELNNWLLLEKNTLLERAHEELKESQSRILQQEKMASIGQLAAGVAHEINNPIGFISSNLATLEKYLGRLTDYLRFEQECRAGQAGDKVAELLTEKRGQLRIERIVEDLGNLIGESKEGTERVKKIVQDLKGFSRVDDADLKAVDLHECLESTINIVWNEIKYKARLDKEYGTLPPLRCYPQQLNQVFMNLLVNAAQAIENQGVITVRTWCEEGQVHVAVSDSGCGMPPEIAQRAFEPFFTTKEVGKGTGLGLSISYDIVKKHGGEISVESSPGQGTTFTITLPAADAEVAA